MVQYQGSSPVPRAPSETELTESHSEADSTQPAQFAIVLSIPTLKGGDRALRKQITYPEQAIQDNIEGTVTVLFTIDEEGNTSNFTVLEGIGHGCDEAVIDAIRQSQFEPGHINRDTTARYTWMVSVEFRL